MRRLRTVFREMVFGMVNGGGDDGDFIARRFWVDIRIPLGSVLGGWG